jgi:hypothetical protein
MSNTIKDPSAWRIRCMTHHGTSRPGSKAWKNECAPRIWPADEGRGEAKKVKFKHQPRTGKQKNRAAITGRPVGGIL